MDSAPPTVRIILITRQGCPPCGRFLAENWPSLKDKLSFKIGGGGGTSTENIDTVRDGMDKIPPAIARKLQFVPQIFALYPDDFVEIPKNVINTPAGLKELEEWSKKGPPRYSEMEDEALRVPRQKSKDLDALEVVVVTSSHCGYCAMWKSSGGMQKFLDSIPPSFKKSHYNVTDTPAATPEEARRRAALAGIGVPSAILVKHAKWSEPIGQNLKQSDIIRSPGQVNTPPGVEIFNQWIKMVGPNSGTPFLGYMILATSDSCGHCIAWKKSGGMDAFLEVNKSIPGILLLHNNPLVPPSITRHITGVPSVFFVPAHEWSNPDPDVIEGPHPVNPEPVAAWVKQLSQLGSEGRWSNDANYQPPEYRPRGAASTGLAVKSALSRRPLRRQAIR